MTEVFVPSLQLVDHVNKRLLETEEDSKKLLNLVLYIETAIGMINLKEILQHAAELSEMSRAVIDAVVFGSDDFTASIGESKCLIVPLQLNSIQKHRLIACLSSIERSIREISQTRDVSRKSNIFSDSITKFLRVLRELGSSFDHAEQDRMCERESATEHKRELA